MDNTLTFDDIRELWNEHKKIGSNISEEAQKIPIIHDLFYKIYMIQNAKYKKMEAEHRKLLRDTYEYYSGKLSSEEIKQMNRKPFPKLVLKTDLKQYIDSDDIVINSNITLDNQLSIVEYVKDNVLKNISNRGFQLSQMMDWLKFTHGEM